MLVEVADALELQFKLRSSSVCAGMQYLLTCFLLGNFRSSGMQQSILKHGVGGHQGLIQKSDSKFICY
jgi:hypothetical protein